MYIYFNFKKFFLMWTILKVFIEVVTVLLQFYVFWCFVHEACGILAPRPGIEPAPPVLEGEVSTTGPPRKSLSIYLFILGTGIKFIFYFFNLP